MDKKLLKLLNAKLDAYLDLREEARCKGDVNAYGVYSFIIDELEDLSKEVRKEIMKGWSKVDNFLKEELNNDK